MITEVDLSGTPCFAPGATLKDLKKVNFIFGPNGTGKTSITRILGEGLKDYRSRTWCLSSVFRLGLRAKVAVI